MKKIEPFFQLCLLAICIFLCNPINGQHDPVEDTIYRYIEACFNADTNALNEVLDNEVSIYLNSEKGEILRPNKQEFIEFYARHAKLQKCGITKILNIQSNGQMASVQLEKYVESKKQALEYYITLVKNKGQWKILSMAESFKIKQRKSKKILMVVSNASTHGDSDLHTANHFYEIIVPYDEFTKAGYQVDIVSPSGGQVPIGYINYTYGLGEDYVFNPSFMYQLSNTKRPSDINSEDYAVIFYAGGGAAMYGVPENQAIQKIASNIYAQNGIVSSICHGAAGIVNLKDKNGNYLVYGKKVNGFPDKFENMEAPYYQEFPFSIEQTLKERGAEFLYSEKGWDKFYQIDGRIMTAQDPTGGAILAQQIIAALETLNY